MTREEFRAKLEALCESEATVLTLKNESMLREAEAEDSRRIAMIDQLLAAWDARFNEGIEAAARKLRELIAPPQPRDVIGPAIIYAPSLPEIEAAIRALKREG